MKLGIMGGTFDPIHTGHLIVAEMARQKFSLEKVVFIPAGIPPHKLSRELALPHERLEMVRLAINGNPFFDVCPSEINRDKVSYTVDTLSDLKTMYPKNAVFYFIVGKDSLLELKSWRNPSKLFSICTILVYGRQGFEADRAFEEVQSLRSRFNADIAFVEGPTTDISSTIVREMMMNGMSIKYLVPDAVGEYIYRNLLYSVSRK